VDQIDALMKGASIPVGLVYCGPEMLDDLQFAAREAITEVETERFGSMKMQGAFPKLPTTPSGVRSPAPSRVGQHDAEIYDALLGLTKAEVEGLAANGVV
jgi:crotonobetainyl-CoA:carnitine CoA-transferase CaiB-like acyl-CoA transferase